ncbi:unnamed protein product, partial [Meganyctiphanes norvegica]
MVSCLVVALQHLWRQSIYKHRRTDAAIIVMNIVSVLVLVGVATCTSWAWDTDYSSADDIQYDFSSFEYYEFDKMEHWGQKIGSDLFQVVNEITKYNEIEANYKAGNAEVEKIDSLNLVTEMAENVSNMMKTKAVAVKRIVNFAEVASLEYEYNREEEVDYYNANHLNKRYPSIHPFKLGQLLEGYKELNLVENQHFKGIPVNTNHSTVHVPERIFDKAPDVQNALYWSENLDKTFMTNYESDPTPSWQYFASSTGFLRQYPGTTWDNGDPDLNDARLKSWYREAATSPKNMVVLLDISSSMNGIHMEIAKHVIIIILDTLTENDFFNVLTFNDETKELVSCFDNILAQAHPAIIDEFKNSLNLIETANMANFTKSLSYAFELHY